MRYILELILQNREKFHIIHLLNNYTFLLNIFCVHLLRLMCLLDSRKIELESMIYYIKIKAVVIGERWQSNKQENLHET